MIDMGLIVGDNMIRNKPFYQLYRLSDNEIIRTFNSQEELNTYLMSNDIKLSCISHMLSSFNIKE